MTEATDPKPYGATVYRCDWEGDDKKRETIHIASNVPLFLAPFGGHGSVLTVTDGDSRIVGVFQNYDYATLDDTQRD